MQRALIILAILAVALAAVAGENPSASSATTADISTPGSAPEHIAVLVNELNQAAIRNDVQRFGHFLADNYSAVNTQGQRQTKHEVLDAMKHNRVRYESVQLRNVNVEMKGASATETHIADVKGTWKGKPFAGTVRSNSVWEYRNGAWQVVSLTLQPVR